MTLESFPLGQIATIERDGIDPSDIQSGSRYVGLENIDSSGAIQGVIVKNGELASTKFSFSSEHILYGKLRPYLRKIARPDFNGICSTDIIPIRPSPRVDRGYLFHFLRLDEVVNRAASLAVGINLPRLSPRILETFEVPLPPLDEQRRIAAILDQAGALRWKRQGTMTQLNQIEEAIFSELVGNVVASRWPRITVGEICDVKGGKRLPKGDEYASSPTPFRYVRISDLEDGKIREDKLVYLKPDTQAQIRRYTVQEGDIIISIAGSIGLIAPVPASVSGANLTENGAKLVPKLAGRYDPIFLSRLLQTSFVQDQMRSKTGQVTIGKLALFRIEQIEIPLPGIDVQRIFAARAGEIDKLKTRHRDHLAKLDVLFASLQHRAFRGEL